jgi:mannosyltransferase
MWKQAHFPLDSNALNTTLSRKEGDSPAPSHSRAPWIWLALITILAMCLRVIGLNQSLWWDEIASLLVSVRHPFTEIVTVFPGDSQHTLYSVLARLSILAFGEHAWSLRLPALVFGVASVPILFLLAISVTTPVEALLSAALLSVSYHHVWFSQNARGYSALAFWTLLSTYLLLRGIRTERRAPFAGYAITASLGVYMHLTMMFLVASHLLICAAMAGMDWRRGLGTRRSRLPLQAFLMTGGLTFLLYLPIVLQVQNFFVNQPSSMKAVSTPRWAFWETLRGLTLGLGTEGVLVGAALLVACGAWSYFKQSRLVFALFALPGVITALGAILARGTMYPRFYFFLIGFAILILVRGVTVISGSIAATWRQHFPGASPGLAPALTAVFTAVLLAASALSLVRNYRYPKQDFEGAIQFIDAEKKNEDAVVTVGPGLNPFREYYAKPWDIVGTVEMLNGICHQGRGVWVVYTFPRYQEASIPAVMELVRKKFTVIRVFHGTLGDGDVFVGRFQPESRT